MVGMWESGARSVPDVRHPELTELFGFPPTFYERPPAAELAQSAVSFRALSKKTAAQRDATLAMGELAVELSRWLDDGRLLRDAVAVEDLSEYPPSVAAQVVRREWLLGSKPVPNMIAAMERRGVRVFALPTSFATIDACSFWYDDIPYVLVDMSRSAERVRFDLAHEFGHLTLHRSGAPVGMEAERQANEFAGSLLIPDHSVQHPMRYSLSLADLVRLKKVWRVSAAAYAYHLNRRQLLNDWAYKSVVIEMRRKKYHLEEPEETHQDQSPVISALLDAMRTKGITSRSLADRIGMRSEDVRGFMQGIAETAYETLDETTPEERRAAFKVI
jgi:Zn-dependent peptidase ImmA (M78 family)